MSLYYLLQALKEKIKAEGKDYDLDRDQYFFGNIFRELKSGYAYWPFNATHLVNTSHWRMSKLIQKDGTIRKPVAYIYTWFNIRDNLIVEWYPTNIPLDNPRLEETDWIRWGDTWYAGTEPFNRILTLKGFGNYTHHICSKKKTKEEDYYLFRAVGDLLKSIYTFLEWTIEIKIIKDLYIEFDDQGLKKHDVKSCQVRDVEEVNREMAERQKQKWLDELSEKIRMSPEQFLEIFKASGMDYKKTALKVSYGDKYPDRKTIKSWIEKLYCYPLIYDRIIDEPPKDVAPREKRAQLIKVDFSKKE